MGHKLRPGVASLRRGCALPRWDEGIRCRTSVGFFAKPQNDKSADCGVARYNKRQADLRVRCIPLLGGNRLKDRDVAGVDLTLEGKACAVEQCLVFRPGALPPPEQSQHVYIQRFRPMRAGSVGDNRFDQKELGVGRSRPANRSQNGSGLIVSLVVDDFHHQIGVADRQGIPEEIAGLQCQSRRGHARRLLNYVR